MTTRVWCIAASLTAIGLATVAALAQAPGKPAIDLPDPDAEGNVFAAENAGKGLRKYARW